MYLKAITMSGGITINYSLRKTLRYTSSEKKNNTEQHRITPNLKSHVHKIKKKKLKNISLEKTKLIFATSVTKYPTDVVFSFPFFFFCRIFLRDLYCIETSLFVTREKNIWDIFQNIISL